MLHGQLRSLGLLVVLLTGAVALAACGRNGANRQSSHRVVVPNIVGLSQRAAIRSLAQAGLTAGVVSGIPSLRSPAGVVIATDPSPGAPATPGATVSLTVSSGVTAPPASPTTPVNQAACSSGDVSYAESNQTGSVCVKAGSMLRVTFVSSQRWGGYGSWSPSPPTLSDNSVLEGRSWGSSGRKATAVFAAVGAGTATVTASFDVRCAPSDTTPCTVPPEAFQVLTVTVESG